MLYLIALIILAVAAGLVLWFVSARYFTARQEHRAQREYEQRERAGLP